MYCHETKIRIRYCETDSMGYAHHSNYLLYLEQARMELLRNLGIDCKKMEDSGIILPVVSVNVKYSLPIFFDDIITVKTILKDLTEIKLIFDYKIYNQHNKLVTTAKVAVIFADLKTGKPIMPPEDFIKKVELVETSI